MRESSQMDIVIPGKVVVFDYGEVISVVPTDADRAELISIAGAEPTLFWEAYWRHRHALDVWDFDTGDYWRRIREDLGANWGTELLHRLWLADLRSWLRINPDVLDVLIALQRGGTRMALLSNAGRDYSSYFRHGMLGDFFEQVFVSGELGALKPRPEIFRAVLEGLDVTAEEVLFIDDREENIRGAESLGIEGHVFTTAAKLRSFLEAVASAVSDGGNGRFPGSATDGSVEFSRLTQE